MCKKLVFTSAARARRWLGRRTSFRIHTYYCGACKGYHVANADKR